MKSFVQLVVCRLSKSKVNETNDRGSSNLHVWFETLRR